MKYLIQFGKVTYTFSELEKISTEFQNIFRFMLYAQAYELVRNDATFRIRID